MEARELTSSLYIEVPDNSKDPISYVRCTVLFRPEVRNA